MRIGVRLSPPHAVSAGRMYVHSSHCERISHTFARTPASPRANRASAFLAHPMRLTKRLCALSTESTRRCVKPYLFVSTRTDPQQHHHHQPRRSHQTTSGALQRTHVRLPLQSHTVIIFTPQAACLAADHPHRSRPTRCAFCRVCAHFE